MRKTLYRALAVVSLLSFTPLYALAEPSEPIAGADLVFEEIGGIVAIEAEHFYKQSQGKTRAWHITSSKATPDVKPDPDPAHVGGASGGAYLECLPDSRVTHDDKLIRGENFSPEPGKMAVLHYKVHFNTPGRYYVWVRAHSTGSEDNGLHVGVNGTWPETGQRLQWCDGKRTWRWESKQRTEKEHCGEPYKIYLDIEKAGEHEILFSMREDGFEFDKFILTTTREFARPADAGPETRVKAGKLPAAFPQVEAPPLAAPPPPAAPAAAPPSDPAAKPMSSAPLVQPRKPDGAGDVAVSGELKAWHKVTLTLDGPFAHEQDNAPNPFTDHAMNVTFTHESGSPKYVVPGYFAADGDAGNTSAESGTKWRAHLSPDKPGKWSYAVSFVSGKLAAVGGKGAALKPFDGKTGTFTVAETDKSGRDFRASGRLQYVGKHYLQFAGSKQYFLKAGPDAPETLLGTADFDGTVAGKANVPLKTWQPHAQDWKDGDPTWKGGRGKGLVGALNYLSGKGLNVFSFLTYNAGGDGDNVWPFVARDAKLHYDCSKLDQWGIVFDHATMLGLYCHFKLQETENDDNRRGGHKEGEANEQPVPTSLDGGDTGTERKLYLRELIARYGHLLALNWNLGEENTQSPEQQKAMAEYIRDTDPYKHHIVVHTYPNWQEKVYPKLLGKQSVLTGASLQNSWSQAHQKTLQWVTESAKAGKPWVVANDEQNPASDGVPADAGYEGNDGTATQNGKKYTMHDVRKLCLWGTLMAGGAGVEYYFGYKLPQNDLVCQDFRSRDKSWDYCRIALAFFQQNEIPFWEMQSADALVGNDKNDNSRYCLARKGEVYVVYLPTGGTTELDLSDATGDFAVKWFNPRTGGELQAGSVTQVRGGKKASLGNPPADANEDWAIIVRR